MGSVTSHYKKHSDLSFVACFDTYHHSALHDRCSHAERQQIRHARKQGGRHVSVLPAMTPKERQQLKEGMKEGRREGRKEGPTPLKKGVYFEVGRFANTGRRAALK